MPGTADGTVRCNAVIVARAISSDVYFFLQSKPISHKKISN
jgi:hypothetical protein